MKPAQYRHSEAAVVIGAVIIMILSGNAFCYPPDNAAVLYYKACLVVGDPPDEIADVINDAVKGNIEVNNQLKDFAQSQTSAIELTIDAAKIEGCDWGMDYSEGFELLLPHLGPMRRLCKVVLLDAQIKAADGDLEKAIDQSLACFKIARHIKKDSTIISSLVGISAEQIACETIASILSKYPVNEKLLIEVRNTLNEMTKDYGSMKQCLSTEAEIAANYLRTKNIPELLKVLGVKDDQQTAGLNAQILDKSIAYYRKHMKDMIETFQSPYPKAIEKMNAIQKKMSEDAKKNNEAVLTSIIAPAMEKCLNNEMAALNRINALRCAVEIYLQKLKDGALPVKLPSGAPKDNFSNKNFIYEKIDTGFILRCQGKDLVKDEIHEYEFKADN